ncbi:MAG: hypothetical protein IPN17_01385 [Deltaproteobacteria bacterium]|nr:hypothetical protein [Deltaproteobacteria bacterium]
MARRPHSPVLDASTDPSDADVEAALAALPAEKLRAFVAAYLRGLDAPARRAFWAALVPRAARRPGAGTTKRSADATLCEDIAAFVRTATRVGEGSPAAVDSFLERATRVFLNGDAALARRAFEAMLKPLAEAEFSLGEDEMLEEVLSTPLDEVVARLVTVFLTTPQAIVPARSGTRSSASGVSARCSSPSPRWSARRRRSLDDPDRVRGGLGHVPRGAVGPRTGCGRDIGADRMLREAVARAHGVEGLRRLAETSGGVEAFDDWATALLAEDRREAALKALQAAIARVPSGDDQAQFADRAARVARPRSPARRAWAAEPGALRRAQQSSACCAWWPSASPRRRRSWSGHAKSARRSHGSRRASAGRSTCSWASTRRAQRTSRRPTDSGGRMMNTPGTCSSGVLVALVGAAAASTCSLGSATCSACRIHRRGSRRRSPRCRTAIQPCLCSQRRRCSACWSVP